MMKTCNKCGAQADNHVSFCISCGAHEFTPIVEAPGEAPAEDSDDVATAVLEEPAVVAPALDEVGNGNIVAGIVGAFLFSIIGGLMYFVVYQIGVIAGVCGLVMFILANFGYGLFAKTKNKTSVVGLVVSFIAMLAMIFIAEYACLSYEIYDAFKDAADLGFDLSFFDSVKLVPELLKEEPEVKRAVITDLIYAYAFGLLAAISQIVTMVKGKKKQK